MKKKDLPTKERLHELFNFDFENGLITRKTTRGNRKAGDSVGTPINTGYITVHVDRQHYTMHRIMYQAKYGDLTPEFEVDHIDLDRANNKISNLRIASYSQNEANKGVRKDNKLGVKGVCWDRARNGYMAQIQVNKKKIHLGIFESIKDAKRAYDDARNEYYGEFSRG